MNRPHLHLLSAAIVTHFALAAPAMAMELPKVQFVNGEVKVLKIDGSTVDLKKGDVVKPGEKLITGGGGVAQIKTPEQGVVALRKNTEIEFKAVGDKFDVALNHGQLRTVTALAQNQPARELKVLTPGSSIAVKNGDNETGVTTGAGGQTTSQAHLGEVNVQGKNGESLNLTPGQMISGAGDAPLKPLSEPAPLQPSVGPPTNSGSPAADSTSLVALNAPAAPIAPLPTGAPNNLGADLMKSALAGLTGPGARVPNLNSDLVKIPETRVELVNFSAAGVDDSINNVLANVTALQVDKPGIGLKTLTPTDSSALPSTIKPTFTVPLTQIDVSVGVNNSISALKPLDGTKFSNSIGGGKIVTTDSFALTQQIGTTATTTGQSATLNNSLTSVVQTASANNINGAAFTSIDVGKLVDLSSTTKTLLVATPPQTANLNITAATQVLPSVSVTTTAATIAPTTPTPTTTTLPVPANILPVNAPVLASIGAGNQTIISSFVPVVKGSVLLLKSKLR